MRIVAAWVVVVACGSPDAPVIRPRQDRVCAPREFGDASAYTVATDAQIAAPATCATLPPDEAYVRIAGGGDRPFHIASPGHERCRPEDKGCPTVDLGHVLRGVQAELESRGIQPVSWGPGMCGRGGRSDHPGATWEDKHWSVIVYHWKHMNDAVAVVAAALREANASQSLEVAVEHVGCGTPE